MRKLVKALVLVLMPMVVLAACDKKSDAATSSSYDTSPASNARLLDVETVEGPLAGPAEGASADGKTPITRYSGGL